MSDLPRPTGDSEATSDEGFWGVDAALGAASIAARLAGGVASTVVASGPARAVEGAARWMTRPLSREGEAVRDRLGEEGVPAAKDAIRRFTPGVVDAIDLDSIMGAVDVAGLIGRVDVDGIVGRVDIDGILTRIDIDALLARIDIGALLERIDLNQLLTKIDLNQLLTQVDLNALLGDVDLDALLAGVDLNALLADLDLNAVVDRLDVDALIANTEMGAVIVRSTGGAASEALDAVRSQGVSIDSVITRIANRLLRRDVDALPTGPPLLVDRPLALPSGVDESDRSDDPARPGPGAIDTDAIDTDAIDTDAIDTRTGVDQRVGRS